MNVSRITVGRVFNLGNYENIRYEVSVDVHPGESAYTALIGLENIIGALSPVKKSITEESLKNDKLTTEALQRLLDEVGPEEFKRKNDWQMPSDETAEQFLAHRTKAWEANVKKFHAWQARYQMARQLLDNLGGAAVWKDAKQNWDDDTEF